MNFLSDWFFKGLCLSSLAGLIFYMPVCSVGYDPTWTVAEVFLTFFGTGFMIAAFIYTIHSISLEGKR